MEQVAVILSDFLPTMEATIGGFMAVFVPALLCYLAVKLWQQYVLSTRDNESKLPLPPGTLGLPVIGETLSLALQGYDFYRKRRNKFGNVYKTHILGRPTIRVNGAQNVRKILLGEDVLVTMNWPTSTRMLMGEGALAQSSGATHRWRRASVMKAFTPEGLSSYMPAIQSVLRDYIHNWCRQGFVLGYPECRNLAFSISAKVLLGFDFTEKEKIQMIKIFEGVGKNMFSLPFNVPGSGLHKGMKARNFLLSKIEDRIKHNSRNHGDSLDAMTTLYAAEESEKLSLDELKDAALEMLFAGHEKLSSAACTMILNLAQNPEVVEKISGELFEHELTNNQADNDLSYEKLKQLKYANNVVKECLRITAPVGAGYRKVTRSFELEGYQIPKGWTVAYSIRDIHETTTLFRDPETFNPDRWTDDPTKLEEYNYIPFGSGNRSCVGEKFTELTLASLGIELVRNCTWRLLTNSTRIKHLPVPYPVDNLPVEFTEAPPLRQRAFTL